MRGVRLSEDLPHRVDCAGQLRAIACEAEPQIPFAIRSEVDARHAADTRVPDQVFRYVPRDRVATHLTDPTHLTYPTHMTFVYLEKRVKRAGARVPPAIFVWHKQFARLSG